VPIVFKAVSLVFKGGWMKLIKGDVCSVFKGAVLIKRLCVVDQQGCEVGSRELNEAGQWGYRLCQV
jgi:hypothetical protein